MASDENVDVGPSIVYPVIVETTDDQPEFIEIDNGEKGERGDAGPQGPIGPRGPQGPPGQSTDGLQAKDIAFVYTQGVADNVWVINHPLPFTPTVTVVDSAGSEQEGAVRYAGQVITVTFSGAFSGTAYLS